MRDDWQAIIEILMFAAAMVLVGWGIAKVYIELDQPPPIVDPDLHADGVGEAKACLGVHRAS